MKLSRFSVRIPKVLNCTLKAGFFEVRYETR